MYARKVRADDSVRTFLQLGIYPLRMTPQAIFLPEFPDGWVVKSSGPL